LIYFFGLGLRQCDPIHQNLPEPTSFPYSWRHSDKEAIRQRSLMIQLQGKQVGEVFQRRPQMLVVYRRVERQMLRFQHSRLSVKHGIEDVICVGTFDCWDAEA
jgi:hypothetical protein